MQISVFLVCAMQSMKKCRIFSGASHTDSPKTALGGEELGPKISLFLLKVIECDWTRAGDRNDTQNYDGNPQVGVLAEAINVIRSVVDDPVNNGTYVGQITSQTTIVAQVHINKR